MSEHAIAALILGRSAPIRQLQAQIAYIAPSPLPVLIQGPTGAGKELVAQAIHRLSGRRGALIAFNVCAIAESMFEAALFGHKRGAFTGAIHNVDGLLAEADGGTAFFDEINGLSLANQAKLIRAIETREFWPVGAPAPRRSNFRVVAATNTPLGELVARGHFRLDLLHRLNALVIDVPPLTTRRSDIPLLAAHFARQAAVALGRPEVVLTAPAVALLLEHDWPGNVRELRHVIERAVVFAPAATLGYADIAAALGHQGAGRGRERAPDGASGQLLTVLARCAWDTALAAAQLGVDRATIYRRLRRLGTSLAEARARHTAATGAASEGSAADLHLHEARLHSHPEACECQRADAADDGGSAWGAAG